MLKRFYSIIERGSTLIDQGVRWFTVLLTVGFTLIVFISVLTRYVFDFSIISSVEVSKLLFVWSCFMAATIAYKKELHIRFEFSSKLLGEKGITFTDICIHSLTLIFFVFLFLKSLTFIQSIWRTYFPVMEISQGWLYVSVAVSGVIFIIHNVAFFLKSLLDWSASPGARINRSQR